jgi:hypothetical protein
MAENRTENLKKLYVAEKDRFPDLKSLLQAYGNLQIFANPCYKNTRKVSMFY